MHGIITLGTYVYNNIVCAQKKEKIQINGHAMEINSLIRNVAVE